MQESYSHCVPKDIDNDKNIQSHRSRRICVVFRTGEQKHFAKDTGEACIDLSPRLPITYIIGPIPGLEEGSFYTRRALKKMSAFQVGGFFVIYSCKKLLHNFNNNIELLELFSSMLYY